MSTRAGSEGLDARELSQDSWGPFFEEINRRIENDADIQASLEIVSPDIVGPAAEHLPLDSITHEDGDDEIAIGLGGRGRGSRRCCGTSCRSPGKYGHGARR